MLVRMDSGTPSAAAGISRRLPRAVGTDAEAGRLKVAIAHDYLTQRGGAERVVLAMARAFPGAPIYTTLYEPDATFPEFQQLDVRPSWLNRSTFFRKHHRAALPLLPLVSGGIHIEADVVVASSSGWAHGFRADGRKVVYCYSPARWLYQGDRYLGDESSIALTYALRGISPLLRRWDRRAAATADSYLAISTAVQQRIRRVYGRASKVVPAPFSLPPSESTVESERLPEPGYFLVVSRLLPYKNVGVVVEAFRLLPSYRLVVVGTGPEKARLIASAPSNAEFLENLSDAEMSAVYDRAAGLIAASYEDFGLTPLEAAARGKASAVLRWGGFLDTVVEGETGVFFDQPHAGAIAEAVVMLAGRGWDPRLLQARAARYGEEVFATALRSEVDRLRGYDQGPDAKGDK